MAYESDLALRLVPYVAGEQPKNVKLIIHMKFLMVSKE